MHTKESTYRRLAGGFYQSPLSSKVVRDHESSSNDISWCNLFFLLEDCFGIECWNILWPIFPFIRLGFCDSFPISTVTKIYGYVFFVQGRKIKKQFFLWKCSWVLNKSGYFVFPLEKRNKPVWVGVNGEDGLGNKGSRWWDDGGWLPAPATTVRCECEVSGGDGFRFRWN